MHNFDLDDIPEDNIMNESKKRVNGKKKGNRYELEVAKDLSSRYDDTFRRVPQSGAIVGGLNRKLNEGLTSDAQEIFAGDIIAPQWFPFTIECKNYADTPKIHNLLSIGDKDLDTWIKQAKTSSDVAKKEWLLCFKITQGRKSFACVDFEKFNSVVRGLPKNFIIYKNCIIIDYEIFFRDFASKYFCNKEDN